MPQPQREGNVLTCAARGVAPAHAALEQATADVLAGQEGAGQLQHSVAPGTEAEDTSMPDGAITNAAAAATSSDALVDMLVQHQMQQHLQYHGRADRSGMTAGDTGGTSSGTCQGRGTSSSRDTCTSNERRASTQGDPAETGGSNGGAVGSSSAALHGHSNAAGLAGPSGAVAHEPSLLVRFYRDGHPDSLGRTLQDMIGFDDTLMEMVHNHMQWMFPLHEPSLYSIDAETLTETDIQTLSTSPDAQAHMMAASRRFRAFLGVGDPAEPRKWRTWARFGNHNLLRVTRVLRSLRLFRLHDEARSLYGAMMQVAAKHKLPERTLTFWAAAVQDEPQAGLRSSIRAPRPRDESTPAGWVEKLFRSKKHK